MLLNICPNCRTLARSSPADSYNAFTAAGLNMVFVQDNQSNSKKGVLRGLHFQKAHPQGKLVRVIKGEVFDVIVDIRNGSKTFGKPITVACRRDYSCCYKLRSPSTRSR